MFCLQNQWIKEQIHYHNLTNKKAKDIVNLKKIIILLQLQTDTVNQVYLQEIEESAGEESKQPIHLKKTKIMEVSYKD